MTSSIQLGPWRLECDVVATERAYASTPVGGPEGCGCNTCRNWIAARPEIYVSEYRSAIEQLGIACEKEAEVFHCAQLRPGRHLYGGWWHFIGRVTVERSGYWGLPHVDHVRIMIYEDNGLLPSSFPDKGVVEVKFDAEVPWVLDEPEPD